MKETDKIFFKHLKLLNCIFNPTTTIQQMENNELNQVDILL